MKKLLTIAIAFILTTSAVAQLSIEDTEFGHTETLDGETYIFYTKLFYSGKTELKPYWERTKNELPGAWYSQICIGDLCYAETASEGEFIESMFSGDTSLISVYLTDDGNTSGVAKVDLLIYDPSDSLNNHVVANFTYSAYPTGGVDEELKSELRLYPNPASNEVYLEHNGLVSVDSRIEIRDIIGRKVLDYPVGNADVLVYDISMLEGGVYLLSIVDENGNYELTKKLRVR